MSATTLVETAARDMRFAGRMLRKSPAFGVTAVVTLALAIAVNTAIFSVVDAVLLKLLPYPEPDRLALVTTTVRAGSALQEDTAQNGATWLAIRDRATTIERAVYSTWPIGVNIVASGHDDCRSDAGRLSQWDGGGPVDATAAEHHRRGRG